jgi:hypothetical protein
MVANKNRASSSATMLAKKCVIIVFIVMSVTLFALEIFLDAYYYDYRPAEPQPAHGRIYAAKVGKGGLVYLTGKERVVYRLLGPLSITSFLFGWLLNMRWKQFRYQKKIK